MAWEWLDEEEETVIPAKGGNLKTAKQSSAWEWLDEEEAEEEKAETAKQSSAWEWLEAEGEPLETEPPKQYTIGTPIYTEKEIEAAKEPEIDAITSAEAPVEREKPEFSERPGPVIFPEEEGVEEEPERPVFKDVEIPVPFPKAAASTSYAEKADMPPEKDEVYEEKPLPSLQKPSGVYEEPPAPGVSKEEKLVKEAAPSSTEVLQKAEALENEVDAVSTAEPEYRQNWVENMTDVVGNIVAVNDAAIMRSIKAIADIPNTLAITAKPIQTQMLKKIEDRYSEAIAKPENERNIDDNIVIRTRGALSKFLGSQIKQSDWWMELSNKFRENVDKDWKPVFEHAQKELEKSNKLLSDGSVDEILTRYVKHPIKMGEAVMYSVMDNMYYTLEAAAAYPLSIHNQMVEERTELEEFEKQSGVKLDDDIKAALMNINGIGNGLAETYSSRLLLFPGKNKIIKGAVNKAVKSGVTRAKAKVLAALLGYPAGIFTEILEEGIQTFGPGFTRNIGYNIQYDRLRERGELEKATALKQYAKRKYKALNKETFKKIFFTTAPVAAVMGGVGIPSHFGETIKAVSEVGMEIKKREAEEAIQEKREEISQKVEKGELKRTVGQEVGEVEIPSIIDYQVTKTLAEEKNKVQNRIGEIQKTQEKEGVSRKERRKNKKELATLRIREKQLKEEEWNEYKGIIEENYNKAVETHDATVTSEIRKGLQAQLKDERVKSVWEESRDAKEYLYKRLDDLEKIEKDQILNPREGVPSEKIPAPKVKTRTFKSLTTEHLEKMGLKSDLVRNLDIKVGSGYTEADGTFKKFSDDVEGGYQKSFSEDSDGTIIINSNLSTKSLADVLSHEIVHYGIEKTAGTVIDEKGVRVKSAFKEAFEENLNTPFMKELSELYLDEMREAEKKQKGAGLEVLMQEYFAHSGNRYIFSGGKKRQRTASEKVWLAMGNTLQKMGVAKKDVSYVMTDMLKQIGDLPRNRPKTTREQPYNDPDLRYSKSLIKAPQYDTPEFKRYFKDSKVRDKDGNMLVVSHGTPTATFSIFSKKFIRKNNLVGKGFYFTSRPELANTYVGEDGRGVKQFKVFYNKKEAMDFFQKHKGPGTHIVKAYNIDGEDITGYIVGWHKPTQMGIYPAYLNIKNPIDADFDKINYKDVMKYGGKELKNMMAKKFVPTEKDISKIEQATIQRLGGAASLTSKQLNKIRKNSIEQAQQKKLGKTKGEFTFFELKKMAEDVEMVRDMVEKMGYDGITHQGGIHIGPILHKVWVAFEPNQIKSIYNMRPTKDPDIRFSKKKKVAVKKERVVAKKEKVAVKKEKVVEKPERRRFVDAYHEWQETGRVTQDLDGTEPQRERKAQKEIEQAFGITKSYFNAGWITSNGKMINFNRTGEKEDPDLHNDIAPYLYKYGLIERAMPDFRAAQKFMDMGNIRINAGFMKVSTLSKMFSDKQKGVLKEYINKARKMDRGIDIKIAVNPIGEIEEFDPGSYKEYPYTISVEDILTDVKERLSEGLLIGRRKTYFSPYIVRLSKRRDIKNAKLEPIIQEEAEKKFGYTKDWEETGFIAPNGKQIKMTNQKGKQAYPHRTVHNIFKKAKYSFENKKDIGAQADEAVSTFLNMGNIRVSQPHNIIEMSTKPTDEQLDAIRSLLDYRQRIAGSEPNIMIKEMRGHWLTNLHLVRKSLEDDWANSYPMKTAISTVIRDIENVMSDVNIKEEPPQPSESIFARFLYKSKALPSKKDDENTQKAVEKTLSKTKDILKASYITPDGHMLTSEDPKAIDAVFREQGKEIVGWEAVKEFSRMGNIMVGDNKIVLSTKPNESQIEVLKKYVNKVVDTPEGNDGGVLVEVNPSFFGVSKDEIDYNFRRRYSVDDNTADHIIADINSVFNGEEPSLRMDFGRVFFSKSQKKKLKAKKRKKELKRIAKSSPDLSLVDKKGDPLIVQEEKDEYIPYDSNKGGAEKKVIEGLDKEARATYAIGLSQGEQLKAKNRLSFSGLVDRFGHWVADNNYPIVKHLANTESGQRVIMYLRTSRGASGLAQHIVNEAKKKVFEKIKSNERNLFALYLQYKRTEEVDKLVETKYLKQKSRAYHAIDAQIEKVKNSKLYTEEARDKIIRRLKMKQKKYLPQEVKIKELEAERQKILSSERFSDKGRQKALEALRRKQQRWMKEDLAVKIKHTKGLETEKLQHLYDQVRHLDPELMSRLEESATRYWEFMESQLLELHKEGLIDTKTRDVLLANHKHYSPRMFIHHIDDSHIEVRGKKAVSVHDSGIKALKEGSEEAMVNDPLFLMEQVALRTQSRIFKNRAAKALYEYVEENPNNELGAKIERPVFKKAPKTLPNIEAEHTRISSFHKDEEGNVEEGSLLMPNEIAQYWQLQDPQVSPLVANFLKLGGSPILKALATGYNPEFFITNLMRDFAYVIFKQHKAYGKFMPFGAFKLAKDMISVSKDVRDLKGLAEDYIRYGGSMEFLTTQGFLFKRGEGDPPMAKWLENFSDIAGWLGNRSEMLTRVALMKRFVDMGMSKQEAAYRARANLDFAQGGILAKTLDNAIPYLNASIQGTRGVAQEFMNKKTVGVATYKAAQIMIFAFLLKLMRLYADEDREEKIGVRENTSGWIIPTYMKFKDPTTGEMRYSYFKFQKDQGQRLFASFAEELADFIITDEFDVSKIKLAFYDAVPLGMLKELPPIYNAIITYVSNFDSWRGRQIFKKSRAEMSDASEYWHDTEAMWVQFGSLTGLSPERSKEAFHKVLPKNVITDLMLMPIDATLSTLSDDERSELDKPMIDKISSFPIARRIFRVTRPERMDELQFLKDVYTLGVKTHTPEGKRIPLKKIKSQIDKIKNVQADIKHRHDVELKWKYFEALNKGDVGVVDEYLRSIIAKSDLLSEKAITSKETMEALFYAKEAERLTRRYVDSRAEKLINAGIRNLREKDRLYFIKD